VRRRGNLPAEAEDITQTFFLARLEKRRLAGLAREGGRFRAFLLTSLKNHLANEWSWDFHSFVGDRWHRFRKADRQQFLNNAYRVLLTRARQGIAIFVPEGDPDDRTRLAAFYDQTYLPETGGIHVSARQIQQVVHRVGASTQAWQEREGPEASTDAPVLYVSGDGTGIRFGAHGARCKQSGMRWSEPGAENILALRCIHPAAAEVAEYQLALQRHFRPKNLPGSSSVAAASSRCVSPRSISSKVSL